MSGAWARRSERASWKSHSSTPAQYGKVKGLSHSPADAAYGLYSKGMASSMIGHLQTARELRSAGRWWERALPVDQVPRWRATALLTELATSGTDLEMAFPDQRRAVQPTADIVPIPARQTLIDLVSTAPGIRIVISDSSGVTSAIRNELATDPNWALWCDLDGVGGARSVLLALVAALVGGARSLGFGENTFSAGHWLEELVEAMAEEDDKNLPRRWVLDHCPDLGSEVIFWLRRLVTQFALSITCVVRKPARARKLSAMLGVDPWMMPRIDRPTFTRVILPALLERDSVVCDPDERIWVADELWRWIGTGKQGMCWADLVTCWNGALAIARDHGARLDQGLLQRRNSTSINAQ